MNPVDYLLLVILAVILGGAALFIYKSQKSGKKCIGCPGGTTCSGKCGSCSGCSGYGKEQG
jgi:hypothetical protein